MLNTLLFNSKVRSLALLTCALVLASLLWRSDQPPEPLQAEGLRGPSEPDGFVINGDYRSFDSNGDLAIRLSSPRIEQFETSERATLVEPEAILQDQPSDSPWQLTARRGDFHQATGQLSLNGNVVVTRPLQDGQAATLSTEHLTLDNRSRTVHTNAPVTLTDAFGTTRATGMTAWIDDRVLELTSKVEGHYEPAPNPTP
ncbi:LPS export ABC transporter periplasmic protein LptC [Marinobacter xestospongiae]|uniref:LPS export ABC transporter periplasmic protein LptC n=1 Tax=Marinobacter xestospongiae TaxID=994319 RepID=UPI002006C648|nr:LPS export ABC transporter periplasmic protein LptC [Marinobacter xestospongiae]MCK7567005.1 LPS export ABC transporter periplasmic protein LptC [Marinobacter xestospongiae]